ncbi:MAG: hypothetical protein WCT45_00575 [Candidatus Paceibacterota bacterium]|jgi:hypothetical protein
MDIGPVQSPLNKLPLMLVVAFVAGGIVGAATDPYLPAALSNAKKGYEEGFASAKRLVEESQYGNLFRGPEDVRYVAGTVTAVEGSRLTLRVQAPNPFEDPALAERTVLITTNTKVVKFVPKDEKAYQAELATFTKSAESKVAGAVPPAPFTRVVLDASSVTADTVVVATASYNIKDAKEFQASEIQVQPKVMIGK